MRNTPRPGLEHVFSFLVPLDKTVPALYAESGFLNNSGKDRLGVSYSGNCLLKPIHAKHLDALDALLG